MRREDFINEINDMDDLYGFLCDEELYEFYDDIYDENGLDERLNEMFLEDLRYNNWRDVYSNMSGIPEGFSWYRIDSYDGEVYGIDETDFQNLKQEVLEHCDDNEMWDEEDEDEEDAELYIEESKSPEVQEEEEYQMEDESVMLEMFASAQCVKDSDELEFDEEFFDDPELSDDELNDTSWINDFLPTGVGVHESSPFHVIGSVTVGNSSGSTLTGTTIERSC